jgi:hypothetical protein
MFRLTVSVLMWSVILWRSQNVGWKGITDKKVMQGGESKRALEVT